MLVPFQSRSELPAAPSSPISGGAVAALIHAARVAPAPALESSINTTMSTAEALMRSSLTDQDKAYVAACMGSVDAFATQLAIAKIQARMRLEKQLSLEALRQAASAAAAAPSHSLSTLSELFPSTFGSPSLATGTLASLFRANTTQMMLPTSVAAVSAASNNMEGGKGTFPMKLHQMLSDLEQQGRQDIASFLQHGKAFAIHKPREFVRHVMPKYFRMSRFSSFQRQLNLYDFQRITEGVDRGAYMHAMFVYGQPQLTTTMKRNKIKGVKKAKEEAKKAALAAAAAEAGQQHDDASSEHEDKAEQ